MAVIYIAVPVRDRKAILEHCVPTIQAGMQGRDMLALYDDGSTEFDCGWLARHFNCIGLWSPPVGIEVQRRRHIKQFWKLHEREGFTHLYLTDGDALHSPGWRYAALALQHKYGGAPVCLYDTLAHAHLYGNTLSEDDEVVWRRFAPGISYFLTVEHVAQIMPHLDQMTNFDWQIPEWLGFRFAVSRRSYVDHIAAGGLHWQAKDGLDGGDRCQNPTEWLQDKRKEVIAALKAHG